MSLSRELRATWPQMGRRPSACRAAKEFSRRHADLGLDECESLVDLVATLEVGARRSPEEKSRVLRALLEEAGDPHIHLALLTTLIPGLHHVYGELKTTFELREPNDVMDDVITTASEVIHDWAGESRAYAGPDVLSATRQRVRRVIVKDRQRHDVQLGDEVVAMNRAAAPAYEIDELRARLEEYLQSADARGARMALARVYEDRPWVDIAGPEGLTASTAARETRRFIMSHNLVPQ